MWLKINIQKTKVMASSPITSWQIDGKTMETVRDFIFLGSQIITDCDCRHEIKVCLFLGRKNMANIVSSVTQLCPTLCDPMDCSTPAFPYHHQILQIAEPHVHQVSDALKPSHPLLSPSPPVSNLS